MEIKLRFSSFKGKFEDLPLLTSVTLVSGVPWMALTAEGAPVGEAGGVNATRRTCRRHTHAVRQPAAWCAVNTFTWGGQVIHLRDTEGRR